MEVYITKKNWNKIINYAKCASEKWGTEIGGMAVTIQDSDNDWEIKDPMIMKQEVSSALCELDKTELAKYYSKMAMKYKKHNMRFCWWHSHAKMSAFWSGTDTNTIDEYEDGDLSFALVVNVKQEYKCRVSIWKPFVAHQDVELNIVDNTNKSTVPRKIEVEVVEACTQPKPISSWHKKTYKNGMIVNSNQSSLWGETTEEDKERAFIRHAWEQLSEKVDEVNGAFITGEYDYNVYAKKIKGLNKRLKKAKLPLEVDLISQNNFEDLLSMHSWDLIKCDVGYEDLDPSEALMDYYSYNQSYEQWRK